MDHVFYKEHNWNVNVTHNLIAKYYKLIYGKDLIDEEKYHKACNQSIISHDSIIRNILRVDGIVGQTAWCSYINPIRPIALNDIDNVLREIGRFIKATAMLKDYEQQKLHYDEGKSLGYSGQKSLEYSRSKIKTIPLSPPPYNTKEVTADI